MLIAVLCPHLGQAQFSNPPPVRPLSTQHTTNLFATWKGNGALDGVVVELPADWTLQEARALRYGYEPVSLETRAEEDSRYVVAAPKTLQDPFDLILRVRTGSSPGSHRWSITPFSWQAEAGSQRRVQSTYRLEQHLRTRAQSQQTTPTNYALSFSGDEALEVHRRALPALSDQHPYTVAFWMRTHTLGTVVLSTWNGEEGQPYPMEGVVGLDGRFSLYRGREGLHESVTTPRPIADGQWHHIAVTYAPAQHRLVLFLNGTGVDSLQANDLPYLPDVPLALGGRAGRSLSEKDSPTPYTGLIDDLLVIPGALSAPAIRSRMTRPPAPSEDAVILSLEEELPRSIVTELPATVERVPARRNVEPPITTLRAEARGDQIELTWQARDAQNATFHIERSTDGHSFESVGKLSSPEAVSNTSDGTVRFRFGDSQPPDQSVLYYRVRRLTGEDEEDLSRTLKVGRGSSEENALLIGNSPNPFSTTTTIAYRVSQRQRVNLSVWNLSGHRVTQLVDAVQQPDYYEVTFAPRQLPSGTYFARLNTPTRTESLKMTLVR